MAQFEVALFEKTPDGAIRMISRSVEPRLVTLVRDRLAAERRRELSKLEPPVRLMTTKQEDTVE